MNGDAEGFILSVEAVIKPATGKGVLRKFRFVNGSNQMSNLNSKEFTESKHIPRIILLLLRWKERGEASFSKNHKLWTHLHDGFRQAVKKLAEKKSDPLAPFISTNLVVLGTASLNVQEGICPRSRVDVKVFLGNGNALEGLDAMAEVEKLLRGEAAPTGVRVSDPEFATDLGKRLQLPHANDLTTMLLGKAIWLSRLSDLESIFDSELGIFHRLEGALRDSMPPTPVDLQLWVYAARLTARKLHSSVLSNSPGVSLDEMRTIILSMAEEVSDYIEQESRSSGGDRQGIGADLKRRETQSIQLANRIFTNDRHKKIRKVRNAIDSHMAKCRENLQGLLDEHWRHGEE